MITSTCAAIGLYFILMSGYRVLRTLYSVTRKQGERNQPMRLLVKR